MTSGRQMYSVGLLPGKIGGWLTADDKLKSFLGTLLDVMLIINKIYGKPLNNCPCTKMTMCTFFCNAQTILSVTKIVGALGARYAQMSTTRSQTLNI